MVKLTKESLNRTKIRVPTTKIKDEVVKKLEKLGINVCVKDDGVKHYYIAGNEAGWTGSYSESYYSCHEYKEISHADLLEDTLEFKDWAELYQWASELKPISYDNNVCNYDKYGKCSLVFDDRLSNYTKHIAPPKPKQKKLYAYSSFVFFSISSPSIKSVATTGNGHRIMHLSDVDLESLSFGKEEWKRAPEYDVTYPEMVQEQKNEI